MDQSEKLAQKYQLGGSKWPNVQFWLKIVIFRHFQSLLKQGQKNLTFQTWLKKSTITHHGSEWKISTEIPIRGIKMT